MTAYLFVTLGSWGDLFPYIGIAEELQARGHAVTAAAGPWHRSFGRVANRASWASARFVVSQLFDRKTNRHRRSLGLPPVRASLLTLPLRAEKTLLLCPSEFIDPPPDWPERVTVTGSVAWDTASGPIDSELQAFLDDGDETRTGHVGRQQQCSC